MGEDAKTIAEAKAAVSAMNAQRRFPEGTTPACRHVAMMAEMLSGNGTYPMLADEPRYCATSLAATVRMLWEARAALRALPSATQAGGWMPPEVPLAVKEAFANSVWDALKADANDLRKQRRIVRAFDAAFAPLPPAPEASAQREEARKG